MYTCLLNRFWWSLIINLILQFLSPFPNIIMKFDFKQKHNNFIKGYKQSKSTPYSSQIFKNICLWTCQNQYGIIEVKTNIKIRKIIRQLLLYSNIFSLHEIKCFGVLNSKCINWLSFENGCLYWNVALITQVNEFIKFKSVENCAVSTLVLDVIGSALE